MSDAQNKGPVETIRDSGLVIKIWEQPGGESGPFLTAQLGKTYRDKETGEWREGRSMTREQLLKLPGLIDEANRFMRDWEARRKELGQKHESGSQDRGWLASQRDTALEQATPEAERPAPAPDRGPAR